MRLFKEEEKVQRAKFYPRIIPLANFLTNVSLIIYFANKFSWTNACFKGHFIVQVLMQLQTCGHSRSVLLLKMPDGKFFSRLLFNNLSKISRCIFNRMVYDNKVQGMRGPYERARKKVITSLLRKKTKQTARASKSFGIPLWKQANKNKRTGKGVGTDLFPVHVTFSNCELLTRASNQFI